MSNTSIWNWSKMSLLRLLMKMLGSNFVLLYYLHYVQTQYMKCEFQLVSLYRYFHLNFIYIHYKCARCKCCIYSVSLSFYPVLRSIISHSLTLSTSFGNCCATLGAREMFHLNWHYWNITLYRFALISETNNRNSKSIISITDLHWNP